MDISTYTKFDRDKHCLVCQGDWTLTNFTSIRNEFEGILSPSLNNITIDGTAIVKLDSAGAWLLHTFSNQASQLGITIQLQNFSVNQGKLLNIVKDKISQQHKPPNITLPNWLARFGKQALQQSKGLVTFLAFTGKLSIEALHILWHPSRIRWDALTSVIDKTGFQALPIIALLSFMIGVVISYQMGLQLRNYGANIFIVDLLGFSILREFGPLITAIMVAGRTGSAFAAQLGTMKINQELDALNTMGITPMEILIIPRLVGLFIVLPLLSMWANFFGVLGGMLMAKSILDINWYDFFLTFQHRVPVSALIIGLCKAPVFALLIGSIGCFQGMQTQHSADSIGKQTTKSVVLSIFFIIIIDAIFSVIFSRLGL